MTDSVRQMTEEIAKILGEEQLHSIWLYGSVVLEDFKLGWSDIDFMAFSNGPVTQEQAERLLMLRQALSAREPKNPYYRCFEGIIVSLEEYLSGRYNQLVYWGTSGQRITDRYEPDVFSRFSLCRYGRCAWGSDDRSVFPCPSQAELVAAAREHYEAIRRCAVQTDESLYSCGWLLDIARCLYTLRYHDVIAKTRAGRWALAEHLFADEEPLRKALQVRQDPLEYRDRAEVKAWLASLGPAVQRYANVLEKELESI